ncbi:hypothetical protein K2173_012342 [Erythroxylum novogranatense]|uniref:Uncharacterized protein n=1 Tax=Erythroxylum novogranatense TaxID=1862640 RepID=A0AAV8SCP4_9ROSI|nr:hypothetical protein K2173_012342 [Erythroxylum novogranatense]
MGESKTFRGRGQAAPPNPREEKVDIVEEEVQEQILFPHNPIEEVENVEEEVGEQIPV